jgi:DNA polymerase-1
LNFDDFLKKDTNYPELDRFFQNYELRQFREKWKTRHRGDFKHSSSEPIADIDKRPTPEILSTTDINSFDYQFILITPNNINSFFASVYDSEKLVVGMEVDSTDKMKNNLIGLSFCISPEKTYYLPLSLESSLTKEATEDLFSNSLHTEDNEDQYSIFCKFVLVDLKVILESPRTLKIGHNLKDMIFLLKKYGISLRPIYFDTAIASYILDNTTNYSLNDLAKKYLNYFPIDCGVKFNSDDYNILYPKNDITQKETYFGEKVSATFRLFEILYEKLNESDLFGVAE